MKILTKLLEPLGHERISQISRVVKIINYPIFHAINHLLFDWKDFLSYVKVGKTSSGNISNTKERVLTIFTKKEKSLVKFCFK